jgi:host factor-I protein
MDIMESKFPFDPMIPKAKPAAKPKPKDRAPEQTFEEVRYLRQLVDRKQTVNVKLMDNEEVIGVIEYYDLRFIRLTRAEGPNLFIFKHDIKYISEVAA